MFYSYLIQAIVIYVTIIVSMEMSNEIQKLKEIKNMKKFSPKNPPQSCY